jgi:hypothetical protein
VSEASEPSHGRHHEPSEPSVRTRHVFQHSTADQVPGHSQGGKPPCRSSGMRCAGTHRTETWRSAGYDYRGCGAEEVARSRGPVRNGE